MTPHLLELLRCPVTGQRLTVVEHKSVANRVMDGELICEDGSRRYPIRNFIPRFVPPENYAASFGLQWNRFRRTQLDSTSGVPISRDRFFGFSRWTPEELRGSRVLEVGCGAGRFTEIVLDAGADVVALDYSSAVDACWANHSSREGLNVVQGDVYQLPFLAASFDFVFCFGVLQHTPDVRRAFMALPRQLRPGGRLAVDLYPRLRVNPLLPRYWLRPLTSRIPPERLFRAVEQLVPVLLPVSELVRRVPVIGRRLRHAVPVANYTGVFDLSPRQVREWAVLDTFDWLAPRYDQPQTARDLASWFAEAAMTDVVVERPGFLVGRGTRPPSETAAAHSTLDH